ncbi:amidohydrolase [Flavobacterium sp.]|uniref:amidohydrolase n=1 Tax=Flavobacterium sp. TaxID=239 RepID=UPI002611735E|nr:amidohydrolase [Flavobacterium sp.]
MQVALVQTALEWENPSENRALLDKKLSAISPHTDLVVLPEMFTTGFTMHPNSCAETMEGPTVEWMRRWAHQLQAALVGSVVIEENGLFYNRLLFVTPEGDISMYDKKHRFTLAGEDRVYEAGSHRVIIDYKGWKICPLICYDLRFPVFSRNTEEYDISLYVANWPAPRIQAWDVLLRARAVENMCYTLGVNRVGIDGNGLEYPGHSQAVDCFGNYLLLPQQMEEVFIVEMDKEKLVEARSRFPFLNDRDPFTL